MSDYRLPASLTDDIHAHETDVKGFLDGTLEADAMTGRRVPRGVYEQRQDGTYMTRVRIAAGSVSAHQARAVAAISRTLTGGRLHVTTRQDIQFHDVDIADTPAIMRRLSAVDLSSKGGGGNTVRNVSACPYAGLCPNEQFDVRPFVFAVTE